MSVNEGSNDKSLDPSVALLLQDDAMRQIATTDFVSLAMTEKSCSEERIEVAIQQHPSDSITSFAIKG
ncbi:MAG: hypothetical protein ACREOW_07140 [Thermodesulfobacteriota bacterium]